MAKKRKAVEEEPQSEIRLSLPDFRIRNVELDLLKHSSDYSSWALEVVRLENQLELRESRLEAVVAPLRDDIRDALRLTHGRSGVTEKMVEDRVTLSPEVRRHRERIRKTNAQLRLAKAVLKSLEAKLSSMQSFARLKRDEFNNS